MAHSGKFRPKSRSMWRARTVSTKDRLFINMIRQRNALTVLAAAVGLCSAVSAQSDRLGVLIRGGIFAPTDVDARDVGSSWFIGGGELFLGKFPLIPSSGLYTPKLSVSVDAYSKEGAAAIPILANFTQYTSKNFFWSLGVGGSVARRPGFEDSFELAYQVGVGYEWGQSDTPITFQLRFFSVNNAGSILDGFAMTVGVKL